MQQLVLDGVDYVPLKIAAAQTGYEKNYLGQLCRAGKVNGRLVGRNWYVNLESLEKHTSLDYGDRGTTAFVAPRGESRPTIFPRLSDAPNQQGTNISIKNIVISPTAKEVEEVTQLPTISQSAGVCLPQVGGEVVPTSVKINPERQTNSEEQPSRVQVIPVFESRHTQPRVDLSNLLPPPPKSQALITPRVRPISRYFNEEEEISGVGLMPIIKAEHEASTSLQDEVQVLRQERERRAHQYLVQQGPQPTSIDPLPGLQRSHSKISFDWFVPVTVSVLGLFLLSGVGYATFEYLSHKEYAVGSNTQQALPPQDLLGLFFERRVEYK